MRDEQIVTLLQFEDPAGMPIEDAKGSLDLLQPCAGAIAPTRERGPIGFAAIFNPSSPVAVQAKDLVVGGTVLPRDLSVIAIMRWDFDAQNSYGSTGAIISRGLGTGAVEYMPFALELHVVDHANRLGEARWLWHTVAGVLKTETGGEFVVPTDYFMLTATRRWISPTSVAIRYYINATFIVEVASADGDIAGGVDGTTTIGTRYAGAFGHFLAGAIDELAILNYEISFEEIENTWNRISHRQDDGYRQILALMPPGIPISDDPGSRAQADLASMGVGIGFADGLIENVRNNMMPDRSYGPVQRQWEGITKQPARQGDSLDTRRGRVLGHLGSRAGVSVEGVEEALADILDCAPTDLEVIAFDNTIRDSFATLEAERWKFTSLVDVTGGELRIQGANGGSYPWDDTTVAGGLYSLLPVEPARGFDPTLKIGARIFGSLHPHTLPASSDAGFVYWSWPTNSMLFFGLRNVAGSYKVGYQRYKDGIAVDGSWQVIATTALALHYLRMIPNEPLDGHDLAYSTTDFEEASFITTPVAFGAPFQWAGCYHRTSVALSPTGSDVRFGDFAFRNTKGTRPFYFYVYRNPALGGSPDIVGANRILERMRHGYTYGRVITSKSLLAGDPASVCDGGCLGGL